MDINSINVNFNNVECVNYASRDMDSILMKIRQLGTEGTGGINI